MARNQRKFEERTYKTSDGKEIKYTVYFTEGRGTPAIEEGECLRLALDAGCHSLTVPKPVQAFEDAMYYMGRQKESFGKSNPRSLRFVAYAQCIGPDGNEYEDCASAAPDNVEMLKNYLPEMAMKRARVRCLILALGLKGLNADVEFPDQDKADYNGSPSDRQAAEVLAKKAERLSKIQELFDALGLTKSKSDLEKKRNLLAECGIDSPHNKMTVPEMDKFIEFLTGKVREGADENG
jgi:hypothetical protein